MSGFPNKPKILRGAFIEAGLSIPPLFVVFQFNPEQVTRSHSLSFNPRNRTQECPPCPGENRPRPYSGGRDSLRKIHHDAESLDAIREQQQVDFQEESISFDIRLDATDKLNKRDPITGLFGLSPQISTLESMVSPKSDTPFGAISSLLGLGSESGLRYTGENEKPPMILFIWGLKRVLPVNINSMSITESEFSTDLNTTRATVSVSLTAIEGNNLPYAYTRAAREVMTTLNLANIADLTNIAIPA